MKLRNRSLPINTHPHRRYLEESQQIRPKLSGKPATLARASRLLHSLVSLEKLIKYPQPATSGVRKQTKDQPLYDHSTIRLPRHMGLTDNHPVMGLGSDECTPCPRGYHQPLRPGMLYLPSHRVRPRSDNSGGDTRFHTAQLRAAEFGLLSRLHASGPGIHTGSTPPVTPGAPPVRTHRHR